MRSIQGRGKLSFGHALLMSVKSMQSRHFSFSFLTRTTLANYSEYSTSVIACAWRSLSTSSLNAFCLFGAKLLLFYLTGLQKGLTFNLWVITARSTPPMSSYFQVNTSMFCFRKRMRVLLMPSTNLDPVQLDDQPEQTDDAFSTETFERVGFAGPIRCL